jgi:DNA replication protein DnaC
VPEVWLDRLIAAEQSGRHARSLSYQLHVAKLPHHRDLIHFDWKESILDQAHIEQLTTSRFMDQANNLIFVGGTGTGKTHVASALAVSAIHQGKRIRFYLCPVGTMQSIWLTNWKKKNSWAKRAPWLNA